VDPVYLGIPDYFDIIKKPMDLLTIQKKLNSGEYRDPHEICDDIRLMWDNAWLYVVPPCSFDGAAPHVCGRRASAVVLVLLSFLHSAHFVRRRMSPIIVSLLLASSSRPHTIAFNSTDAVARNIDPALSRSPRMQ
jgi:hypothetical protein